MGVERVDYSSDQETQQAEKDAAQAQYEQENEMRAEAEAMADLPF